MSGKKQRVEEDKQVLTEIQEINETQIERDRREEEIDRREMDI